MFASSPQEGAGGGEEVPRQLQASHGAARRQAQRRGEAHQEEGQRGAQARDPDAQEVSAQPQYISHDLKKPRQKNCSRYCW